jgi:hypothetical protein
MLINVPMEDSDEEVAIELSGMYVVDIVSVSSVSWRLSWEVEPLVVVEKRCEDVEEGGSEDEEGRRARALPRA